MLVTVLGHCDIEKLRWLEELREIWNMKVCGWIVRQEYKSRFSLFSDVRPAVEKSEVLLDCGT